MSQDEMNPLSATRIQVDKHANDEEQRRRAQKQRQRFQERQLEAIRQRIERKPLMKKMSERLQVANNLWRIMEELEKRVPPIRKRDVLHAAGQGGELDSTKRLPRFAINPDLSPAEQENRAGEATQDIRKYVKIAYAAAELSGRTDDNEFLRRLVDGTRFATGLPEEDTVEPDVKNLVEQTWEDLEIAIEAASRAFVSRYDLAETLTKAQDFRIRFDLRGNLTSSPKGADLPSTLAPCIVNDEDLPPSPSVFLGVVSAFDSMPCTVVAEVGSYFGDKGEELAERLTEAGLAQREIQAIAHPVFWAFLEIGPFGPNRQIIPVFRLRPRTLFTSTETVSDYDPFGSGAGCEIGDLFGEADDALVDGCSTNVATDARPDYRFGAAAYDEETDSMVNLGLWAFPSSGTKWDERYASSLHAKVPGFDSSLIIPLWDPARTVLERPISEAWTRRYLPEFHSFCFETARGIRGAGGMGVSVEALGMTAFASRSLAAAIERSLLLVEDSARLDRLLETATRDLVGKLNGVFDTAEQERKRRLNAFLADYS